MTQIEHIAPERLKPFKGNARTHSKRQVAQIARSIKAFGFNNPVLIDDRLGIIAGHGRVKAASLLEMKEVPCLRLSHLSDEEKRAYVLADNQLAEKAGWDQELRALELKGLIDLEFDVTLTGLEIGEVDIILEADREKQSDDVEAALPVGGAPVTQAGDVWVMGNHLLVCGDAGVEATYKSLMGDELAELNFSDPPYNLRIDGFVGGKGRIKHRDFAVGVGELSEQEFIAFLERTLGLAADYSTDGSIHFVCMDWRHLFEITSAGRRVYEELKNVIVWEKDNGGMGTFYRSQHELIFAFKKGKAPHINTFELGQFGRNRTNVWKYAGMNSMQTDRLQQLSMHPTVKPLALVADALKDCSKRNGIVLDPFAGSGTTLIAAEKTGRCGRAIELDPLYCDVIVRRWQNFTGKAATIRGDAQTFEDVELARSPPPPIATQ